MRENPNRISLVEIAYFDDRQFGFTEDFPYWLRNSDGTIAQRLWTRDTQGKVYSEPLVDFTQPELQKMIIAQAVAVAKCGLYDGISLNSWYRDLEDYFPEEIEMAARDKILHGIRAAVPADFLITINTREKIPRWKEYINGVYVNTQPTDGSAFYTAKEYRSYEEVLQWYEANPREPQEVSGWNSGVENQRRHTLVDLEGEIYLKAETPPTADANRDSTVNVLDLVIVANAFGETDPSSMAMAPSMS